MLKRRQTRSWRAFRAGCRPEPCPLLGCLPQFLMVDFFAHDTTHVYGDAYENSPSGPMSSVSTLNYLWNEAYKPFAQVTLSLQPNAFGWNNTNVAVHLSGAYDDPSVGTIKTIVSCLFGVHNEPVALVTDYTISSQ